MIDVMYIWATKKMPVNTIVINICFAIFGKRIWSTNPQIYAIMRIIGSQYAIRIACKTRPVDEVKIGNKSREVIRCEFAEIKFMMPMQINTGLRFGLTIDKHEKARAAEARKATAAIPEIFNATSPLTFDEVLF